MVKLWNKRTFYLLQKRNRPCHCHWCDANVWLAQTVVVGVSFTRKPRWAKSPLPPADWQLRCDARGLVVCRVNVVFIQNTKVKKDSEECKLRIHTISATNITMLCWCMKWGSRLLGYITVKSWLPIIFTIFLTYTASTSKTSAKTKFPLLTFPSINNNAVGRHFIKHQLSVISLL